MSNADKPINPCTIKGRQGFGNQPTIPNREVYGLTKREYFAGLAMQGMIQNMHIKLNLSKTEADIIASQSIQFADELLKQLESDARG